MEGKTVLAIIHKGKNGFLEAEPHYRRRTSRKENLLSAAAQKKESRGDLQRERG